MNMDDITAQLTALLARWDDLAAASAGKVKTADNPIKGGFYTA